MFKRYALAAYGCVKNTTRSTKPVTAWYVLLLTALHLILCRFPIWFQRLAPQFFREDSSIAPAGLVWLAGGSFLLLLLLLLAACGYKNYALEMSRGPDASLKDAFAGFSSPLRCLLAGLVMLLFFGIAVFLLVCDFVLRGYLGANVSVLLAGLVLFITGVVFCTYRPIWFVLFDRPELSVFACFREARQLTKGKRTELFAFDLYYFWFYFLASVLPYFLFALPVLFPTALDGMPYYAQELFAILLGELFSAIFYLWKFDTTATAYACYYNELCAGR